MLGTILCYAQCPVKMDRHGQAVTLLQLIRLLYGQKMDAAIFTNSLPGIVVVITY